LNSFSSFGLSSKSKQAEVRYSFVKLLQLQN